MKWEVHFSYGNPMVFDNAGDAADSIIENDEYIDDMEVDTDEIFDCEGQVSVAGVDYWPSSIVKALDEDRYYEAELEEKHYVAENNKDEVFSELEGMLTGDETRFPGRIRVRCISGIDDEDEDEESEPEENEDLVEILNYVV